MAVELDMQVARLRGALRALLGAKREQAADVDAAVAAIIDDVRARGDAALAEHSLRLDRVDLARQGRSRSAPTRSTRRSPPATPRRSQALELAHARVIAYHERQKPADLRFTDALGVELGWRWRPIEAVGLYVPGGAASYPSSVVMNAVPAKVAGCRRLAMVVPTPDGQLNPLVLAAARIAGVDEIYRVGGAQAIAALAYGTETIAPVAKIVGPGNAYVAAAKRRVFGVVGIDMIAGPSEVVILADAQRRSALRRRRPARPGRARRGRAVDPDHRRSRARARGRQPRSSASSPTCRGRRSPARAGATTARSSSCPSLEAALPLVDRLAPEHLEIMARDPEALARRHRQRRRDLPRRAYARGDRRLCRRLQPRAADRALGAVLLRARRARLHEAHVDAEVRRQARSQRSGPRRSRSARAEGLDAHARSVAIRLAAERAHERTNDDRRDRLGEVFLDEDTIPRGAIDADHERAVAIFDLVEENTFARSRARRRPLHADDLPAGIEVHLRRPHVRRRAGGRRSSSR